MRSARLLVGLTACVLVQIVAGEAYGQAWLQKKDGYYLKFVGSYFYTEEEFNFRGNRQAIDAENLTTSNNSFREIAFTGYAEYGLFKNVTVIAELPFKIVTTKETITPIVGAKRRTITRTNANFSDVTLTARFPLLRSRLALSIQGGAKIPLGYDRTPPDELPALGSGYVDGGAALNLGVSFWPVNAYATAGVGYIVRGGPLDDHVVFYGQAGYTFERVFMKIQIDGIKNTTDPPDLAGMTIVQPGRIDQLQFGAQDVLKLLPAVSVRVTNRLQITGEIYHVLWGKNALAGTTYVLGIILANQVSSRPSS